MGLLCDLFIADPADAPHYADETDDHEWAQEMESLPLGGLTELQFGILWAIIEERTWDVDTHALEHIGERAEDTWLFRFPTAFMERLANLDEGGVPAIAEQWAKTEEMGDDPKELEAFVSCLTDLARKAMASNRGLFLWGSL